MGENDGRWRTKKQRVASWDLHSYADIDREALALAVVELSTVDVEADLPDIQMPILLLVGTNDDMHYTGA